MTKVNCELKDCLFNVNGVCGKTEIELVTVNRYEEGVCNDYEKAEIYTDDRQEGSED